MILPNNGKVVIIDDNISEATPLIAALSKEKVPFVFYYKEDGTDLPESPIDNVRLVFLDLMLVVDNENVAPGIVIGAIANRLRAILNKNNGPYILIFWSTQEERFKKPLMSAFKTTLKEYAPFISFSMPKTNNLDLIKTELYSKFSNFKTLRAFLLFESILNKVGGQIFNDYTNIYEKNSQWNKNLKGIIYSLSKSLVGKDKTNSAKDKQKLKNAFSTIGNILLETFENNINEFDSLDIRKIKDIAHTSDKLAKINSKLHLLYNEAGFSHFQSGNLYLVESQKHDINQLVSDNAETPNKAIDIIASNPILIELDVTPSCDYTQGKYRYIRLLPGILIDESYSTKHIKNTDFNYRLCPSMRINGRDMYMFFDFRFLKTETKDNLKIYNKTKYRLRNDILVDIQTALAKHINRPGIISVS